MGPDEFDASCLVGPNNIKNKEKVIQAQLDMLNNITIREYLKASKIVLLSKTGSP